MNRKNKKGSCQKQFVLPVVGLILLGVILACSSSKMNCTGEVTYQGKTFSGKGKDAEEAQRNGCNLYCLEADEEVEARYQIWLDSPKGKASPNTSKKDLMYKDASFLDFVTKTCMNKCLSKIKDGSLKGQTRCQ